MMKNLVFYEFKFSEGTSSHIQVTEVRQSSDKLSFHGILYAVYNSYGTSQIECHISFQYMGSDLVLLWVHAVMFIC